MTLPELCIRRPVMTSLVMLGILGFGLLAYLKLPVNDLPTVDFPTISVSASLPGASPETMASSVATPLEKQFSTIAGIDSMTSLSALGTTRITIQFKLDRNIDGAALDVQSAIAAALRNLPPDMPNPPSFRKVNPADFPILYLCLVSPTLPLSTVDEYAETTIAQRISMVDGVAQVNVMGSQKYAVRVQMDPLKLASRGISFDEVRSAIAAGNSNLPTGTLQGPDQNFTVQASGKLLDAEAFRPLIVAYRDGAPVRLDQIANVIDSVEDDRVASWFGDSRAIVLSVQRQPGTNTVKVVDEIKKLLPTINAQLPAAVELKTLTDRAQTIRESVRDVEFTLMLTIGLVIMVIFLFLRKVSPTVIASIAIPLSIIGTFAMMYLLNFSLNNLSLMALTLSVGFIVDDAIVVLENIVRHIEKGEGVFEAALKGSREIGFTVISMTLSLAAVFLPVLFMGGILGRLLNEFAVTIGIAILVSGVISLTLTPMLCSRFLRPRREEKHGRFHATTEKVFDGMRNLYQHTLDFSLRHCFSMMLLTAATLGLTAWLFIYLPKGFIPTEDIGTLYISTEGAQDASFDSMVRHQQAIAAVLMKNPYIAALSSSVGQSGGGSTTTGNSGRVYIRLAPRKDRPPAAEIVNQLRPQLASIPGIRAYAQIPPLIRVGGSLTKSPYQYTLSSPDLAELFDAAPKVEALLRDLPQLTDVTSDLQVTSPQIFVKVNRDKASTVGLTANQVETALYNAYGSRQVSSIYTPSNQYFVIMEVTPEHRGDPEALSMLYIRGGSGGTARSSDQVASGGSTGPLVPLGAIADIRRTVGPLTVTHLGQMPSVTISFATKHGVSLGDAVNVIENTVRHQLPPTISTSFQGEAQAFQTSLQGLGLLLVMAVLIIYLVLGILYESFIHPITILSGLPSAGVGALLALMLFGYELNVYGFVGILMLIGIVKKNAIMMIDFAIEARRTRNESPHDAIREACLVRFRPIMMTTFAALMGALPIALGLGSGADARRPLGLAVVGGLLVSQLLTLYITPVFYIYMERLQSWLGRKRSATHQTASALPQPAA